MYHFCQFSMAAGGQNGDFQTFLDFEKTQALWDLLIVKILKLSPDSRYLQKLALKSLSAPRGRRGGGFVG